MPRYLFNEGSFESRDVGMVDSTVHVVELVQSATDPRRLFVDRRPLRAGASVRRLAESRTGHEKRDLVRYTVLAERELPAVPAFEVAAHFSIGSEIVYERRTHVAFDGDAFAFTMRGPIAARAEIDRDIDSVLATLRFREPGWDEPAERDPALYVANELAFELPRGGFVDRTVHELDAPLAREEALSLLIDRAPLAPGATLGVAARARVQDDARRLPLHRIVDHAELRVAGLAAVEVVTEWAHGGVTRRGRQLHVAADRARHLTFSLTAPAVDADVCDRYFDELAATLTLNG